MRRTRRLAVVAMALMLAAPAVVSAQDEVDVSGTSFTLFGAPTGREGDALQGFLDVYNAEKTAEAIEYLLNNPEIAKKMGENGRRRAEQLSWENLTKRITVVYESVLKSKRQRFESGRE